LPAASTPRGSISAARSSPRHGEDRQFQRGADAYQRFNGAADQFPNPCVAPLEQPPFYAVRVVAGELGTFAGIATNAHAQVIEGDGVALEGLYAVGNDAANVMGGTYPGAGITIGPAMTFGYVAARHLAASRKRVPSAPTTALAWGQPASSASSSPVASS
jgi:predicted oxidoreductase